MAINDPMPWQLTVGALRQLIGQVPGEVVVSLILPPTTPRSEQFTLFLNVEPSYSGGPLLQLRPTDPLDIDQRERDDTPVRIAAAGNTVVPAIRVLEHRGFSVTLERQGQDEAWHARRGSVEAIADDPLELLGLVAIVETRGAAWRSGNSEIVNTLERYDLESGSDLDR